MMLHVGTLELIMIGPQNMGSENNTLVAQVNQSWNVSTNRELTPDDTTKKDNYFMAKYILDRIRSVQIKLKGI